MGCGRCGTVVGDYVCQSCLMSLCCYGVCRVVSYPVLKRIRKNYNFFLAILAEETAMSVADLDSDLNHASAGDSDADDSEKLLLQSMLNQEQI